MRYKDEHEKRYSIPTGNNVLFCLLYRHVDDFLKFSDHLKPKIFEGSPKIVQKLHNFDLKITEYF